MKRERLLVGLALSLLLGLAGCSGNSSDNDGGDGGDGGDELEPSSLNWVVQGRGPGDVGVIGVAAFSDGSGLVAGNFSSTVEFGTGEANETQLVAGGVADAYLARFDADGRLAWARNLASATNLTLLGLSAGADGSYSVTGFFLESAVFGVGDPEETTLTAADVSDVFVARFASDDSLAWARSVGSVGEETGLSISSAADGSIVVAGKAGFTEIVFGAGEPNETPVLSGVGGFAARYGADGLLAWAAAIGEGTAAVALDDGEAIVASKEEGWLRHSLIRFDALGAELWRAELEWGSGIVSEVRVTGMASDGSEAIVVAGNMSRPVKFDPLGPGETLLEPIDSSDLFLARYNSDGHLQWAELVGGPGYDDNARVAISPDGTIMMSGKFVESIGFNIGESTESNLFSTGHTDGFLASYASTGVLEWAAGLVTGAEFQKPLGVAAIDDGKTFVGGVFVGSTVFGPGQPRETTLEPEAMEDVFLMRLGP